jgi:hypothetical protein
MILYFCFSSAILVVVALLYVLCKISTIHYAVTINANPSHVRTITVAQALFNKHSSIVLKQCFSE